MKVVLERCCGIDVHKETVVACVITTDETGHVTSETRTFGTLTKDLQAFGEWLHGFNVKQVVMESTGVYVGWNPRKPVYNLLEGQRLPLHPRRITARVARPDPLPHDTDR